MSAQLRCPKGCSVPMFNRVNSQNGVAYLECGACYFVEAITRKPDPHPSITRVHTDKYGHVHTTMRGGVPREPRGPYRPKGPALRHGGA